MIITIRRSESKHVSGIDDPDDYLIVGDPDKKSTWRLPVSKNGVPDHRHMGAAWAALHSGFRGNVYTGPGKAEAVKKLRAMYEAEGLKGTFGNTMKLKINLAELKKHPNFQFKGKKPPTKKHDEELALVKSLFEADLSLPVNNEVRTGTNYLRTL